MASAPKTNLPILYKELVPLNSEQHSSWKAKVVDKAPFMANQHAIPLTVEEFPQAQRDFPIVFSSGDNPVPLALFGLNEGVNVYFDDEGSVIGQPYIPAYIRRYPFLLARLNDQSDNLSLCFDPTAGMVGEFDEGYNVFDDEKKPSEHVQGILKFCENFEQAGGRTKAFMDEIKKADLLMEGEVTINRTESQGQEQPFVYRGFQMINRDKLRELRGDQLRKWSESGLLPLIYAHLFSLDLMRFIFAKQVEQGKGPKPQQNSGEMPPANA